MKAINSHTIRTSIAPKAGPQATSRHFTKTSNREIIKKFNDANTYYSRVNSPRTVTASLTLTAQDDGAFIIANSTTSVIVSLPLAADAPGAEFRVFARLATTGGIGHAVSPNAADSIHVLGFTVAADKDAINTQATAAAGDMITLVSDGVTTWNAWVVGTWARQA